MVKQIYSGPHGNFKNDPYGKNGEHKWEKNKILNRTTKELSKIDGKENKDILWIPKV